ncbi:DUF761 domain-containing protein [Quillaja saponaria]|uniref:DUF761 domain-containing protein n=1 Tax=Quillaja saponaria TaxID=32244 RepID=A0AAD7VHU1_QUISA|nr:DUF761 domain-containing protein [Quillaja saponaria]
MTPYHSTQTQRQSLTQRDKKMFSPSHLKILHPLHVFSMKSSPSSSTLSSMKIKTLIHTVIVSHVCRIFRALSKVKSIVIEIVKENQPIHYFIQGQKKNSNKHKKVFFGSFRLHYNWGSSSHVMPVPAPVYDGLPAAHLYYDSTWNTIIPANDQCEDGAESELSGYLQWLEDHKDEQEINENIDKLADVFIANCHEKFKLEKQESDRRFQAMLARGL